MSARGTSERGATAVLITASMLLLLGMAAIAIDISDAKDERRLDQSAVDVATLGGAVEMIVGGSIPEAVDKVKSLVDTNLGRTLTASAWQNCEDADHLDVTSDVIPGVVEGSECISFGQNDDGIAFARLRVKLPDQASPASFSRILGTSFLATSADAVVVLEGIGRFGSFPAGAYNGAGAGDQFCVKAGTGTAGEDTCENATTGDFGNFQPYFYTDVNPATTGPASDPTCTSGNQPDPLAFSMSNGIDHFLGFTESAPGTLRNGAECPSNPGPANPDRVDSGSGYSSGDVTDGLVKGGSWGPGFDGRLTKETWDAWSGYDPFEIFDHEIDNRPLWTYIDPDSVDEPSDPQACKDAANGPTSFDGTPADEPAFITAQQDILDCLKHPQVPESLFTAELYDSPRLTIIPIFHQSAPIGNNACCYDIMDFVPAFLESIWTDNGAQWTCSGGIVDVPGDFCRHDVGRSGVIDINSAGSQRINSVSATILNCAVLGPPGTAEEKCRRVGTTSGTVTVFENLFLEE